MTIFDRFENAVEKGVNSIFSRTGRSGLRPVDINTEIRRSILQGLQKISSDRTVAPNYFVIHVSPTDIETMGDDQSVLIEEFQQSATDYAAQNDYFIHGPVEIVFTPDDSELTGQLVIDASCKRGAAAPATSSSPSPQHPIVDINGALWRLTEPVTTLGRGDESDITIPDNGVSRRHLELRITPTGVIATDLGSTNGTFVEGHKIDAATLVDGNQIVIGRTPITFWTHSASEPDEDR